MFEKEAEEYAERTNTEKEIEVLNTVHNWGKESLSPEERYLWEGIRDRQVAREQGFKDGAEFGYKKAKEDADKMKSRFLELCHLKDMRIEKLEKANEWHNINDIEPSKKQFGKQLLIRIESVIGDTDYDYLVYKYKGESISDIAGVVAWKEIK